MTGVLEAVIPDKNAFYSLFADGLFLRKVYDKAAGTTRLYYGEDAVIVLYYTYPTHREACVIRNTASGSASLPGLSKKVSVIFGVRASKVDKLRRAAGFLNKNSKNGAYSGDDGFYIRLYFILLRREKINYAALAKLAGESAGNNKKTAEESAAKNNFVTGDRHVNTY